MNEAEVRETFERCGAVLAGHFRLSGGMHSDTYLQCARVLSWPGIAERLGHELAGRFRGSKVTVVLGPALGGIIIAHEVARHLDCRMIFCERIDGRMALRRGFALTPADRVLVVEDVVTTGRSQREALELAAAAGAEVVGVGAICDRSSEPISFGVPFEALLRVQARQWPPEACPLCSEGRQLETPGSRYLGAAT